MGLLLTLGVGVFVQDMDVVKGCNPDESVSHIYSTHRQDMRTYICQMLKEKKKDLKSSCAGSSCNDLGDENSGTRFYYHNEFHCGKRHMVFCVNYFWFS